MSYTTFAYSDLKAVLEDGKMNVNLTVENTGPMSGKEVVQLYVHDEECKWIRPQKELKAFAKVALAPGEKQQVTFMLEERDFAYYNTKYNKWVAETGYFQIAAGSSSRDIRLRERVYCDFGQEPVSFHKFSLVNDWISEPRARAIFESCLAEMNKHVAEQVILDDVFIGFWGDFPVIKVFQMFGQTWLVDRSSDDVIKEMIAEFERK